MRKKDLRIKSAAVASEREFLERGCSQRILSLKRYNKLWHLLLDKKTTKTELRNQAGISTNVIAKLGRNESVSMGTLSKICVALHCDIADIVEMNSNGKEAKV